MHTLPTFRVKVQRGVHLLIIPLQKRLEQLRPTLNLHAFPERKGNEDDLIYSRLRQLSAASV